MHSYKFLKGVGLVKYDLDELNCLVYSQIKNFFNFDINEITQYQEQTISRYEKCISLSANKYYKNKAFSPYNSVQYSIYLYLLSNTMYNMDGNGVNAEKVYYLNKVLNCVDWFYEIKLPDIFGVEHPMGSIMGRASYGDKFFFYQGCTVGGNNLKYPMIGENVVMYSDSKILGNSHIGNNVIISANTFIIDSDIPDNCIVFGQGRDLIIKQKTEDEIKEKTNKPYMDTLNFIIGDIIMPANENKKFIPLSVPNLKGNELNYVTTVVETEWVSTGGPYVDEFEKKIAEYVHCEGAVSCQNGTSGLHISLLLAEVTNDDSVIVPTLTFIAAVNPVKYIGAEPIFMDCDDSLCMDPVKLEEFCNTECDYENGRLIDRQTGRHIKAILVVHVFGNMADMESILKIADKFNLKVIEDATEAIGTYYTVGNLKGKYAGTIGDVGVFSFNGNKIITTGGGGMIVSNNKEYLKEAKHLTTQAKSDELYYEHDEIGYNYRMTNLQAALGLAQLEQLEDFIRIKDDNYNTYKIQLQGVGGLTLLDCHDGIRCNRWFYALFCDGFKLNRDELIKYLMENKIQSRPIWGLISDQIPYEGSRTYKIEKAKYYWQHVVNIPCSTNLSKEDATIVAKTIKNA